MRYNTWVNAVIIGGSGGIGRAVSQILAEKTKSLCIHAGHESDSFALLTESLSRKTKVIPVVHDFSLEKGIDTFFENFFASDLYEQILCADILCICYGPFLQGSVHKMNEKDWLHTSFFNFTFPGCIISKALPSMMKKRFGRIIVFGGTKTDSIRGFKTNAVYGAAKTALCSLVKSVSAQYSDYGITCNAVLPGFIETEYLTNDEIQAYKDKSPGNNMLTTTSVSEAVLFLVSNSAVSGALLTVDGGLHI